MAPMFGPSLPILYRDAHYVAIDKPSGLLVHRTRIAEASVYALQLLRDQLGARVYPVHRLDRPTSGVLMFALSPEAARALAEQFAERTVDKRYLAVVRGYTEAEGRIDYALQEDKHKAAQPAVTDYRSLARVELPVAVGRYATSRYSLVEARPRTGRLHQIRKHFAHIFHPLIGDTTHGEGRHNRLFRERYDIHRLLLHASSLRLRHPYCGETLLVEAPLPTELVLLFAQFGWSDATTVRQRDL